MIPSSGGYEVLKQLYESNNCLITNLILIAMDTGPVSAADWHAASLRWRHGTLTKVTDTITRLLTMVSAFYNIPRKFLLSIDKTQK